MFDTYAEPAFSPKRWTLCTQRRLTVALFSLNGLSTEGRSRFCLGRPDEFCCYLAVMQESPRILRSIAARVVSQLP
jgi:hypothetical protein